jgi:hypothetical protein
MDIHHEFRIYTQYDKLSNTQDKKAVNDEARFTPFWTYIKGQRVDLNVLFESILLNDSLTHFALIEHLMNAKGNYKYNR